ncbi:MAG: hypothetical protein U5P10_12515 [Spirochaetia bacterium]|nr:hypothetical protein [Spirochaetia bacterium]
MPKVTVDMSIEDIAESISRLSSEERETLLLLLSPKGEELKTRKEEIESGKITTLSHEEMFDASTSLSSQSKKRFKAFRTTTFE